MPAPERQTVPPLAWRVLRAAPTRLVLELVAVIAVGALVQPALKLIPAFAHAPKPVAFAIFTAVFVPAVASVYVALVRWLERRPPTELATKGALREVGLGLLLGVGLFSATIGVIALLGGYRVDGIESPVVLVAPIAMAVEAGVVEEIIARGILFRILEEWLGTWPALAISSALFGLAHIANPHATVWSALAITVEAGTMLAGAYMLTRRLWLAIGVHMGWNYTQGGIFGVAVSGNETKGLLHGTVSGPGWLSGGEFGAEASIVAVVLCASTATWLLFRAVRANGAMSASWVRARAKVAAAGA